VTVKVEATLMKGWRSTQMTTMKHRGMMAGAVDAVQVAVVVVAAELGIGVDVAAAGTTPTVVEAVHRIATTPVRKSAHIIRTPKRTRYS
jgi:hypothetical protein